MADRRLPDGWAAWPLLLTTGAFLAAAGHLCWTVLGGGADGFIGISPAPVGRELLADRWSTLWFSLAPVALARNETGTGHADAPDEVPDQAPDQAPDQGRDEAPGEAPDAVSPNGLADATPEPVTPAALAVPVPPPYPRLAPGDVDLYRRRWGVASRR